jgi:hypothetical protein
MSYGGDIWLKELSNNARPVCILPPGHYPLDKVEEFVDKFDMIVRSVR